MPKAGRDLKALLPSLVHVTCVAHGVHQVCEQVKDMFEDMNDLIGIMKKNSRRVLIVQYCGVN